MSALIERAQFARNKRIYEPGAFKAELGSEGALLEWFIRETESFHGKCGCEGGHRLCSDCDVWCWSRARNVSWHACIKCGERLGRARGGRTRGRAEARRPSRVLARPGQRPVHVHLRSRSMPAPAFLEPCRLADPQPKRAATPHLMSTHLHRASNSLSPCSCPWSTPRCCTPQPQAIRP